MGSPDIYPERTEDEICMGGSVSMPAGMNVAMMHSDQPGVAFIGDSIFFYSGMTGLAHAGVSSNRRR